MLETAGSAARRGGRRTSPRSRPDILAGDGIRARHRARPSSRCATTRRPRPSSTRRTGRRHTLEADAILAATGGGPRPRASTWRPPGVRTTAHGAIEVDEHLRTSQPHIFALGDVNGGPQFTYVSLDDARIVLDQLLGDGHAHDHRPRRRAAHAVHDAAARDRRAHRERRRAPQGRPSRSPARTSPTSSRCRAPTPSRRPAA